MSNYFRLFVFNKKRKQRKNVGDERGRERERERERKVRRKEEKKRKKREKRRKKMENEHSRKVFVFAQVKIIQ